MDPQILERQLEALPIRETDFEDAGARAQLDFRRGSRHAAEANLPAVPAPPQRDPSISCAGAH